MDSLVAAFYIGRCGKVVVGLVLVQTYHKEIMTHNNIKSS